MPYFRFSFRIPTFHCFIVATAMLSSMAQGAEWRECEKAKLREIELQQGRAESKPSKGKKSKQASRSERIEDIDTWLWKNCREFSYELRQLEQDRM